MDATADGKSALRIYLGRNRIPLALAAAVLGIGGLGGAPLATRLVSGAQAAETMRTEVAMLQQEVVTLKAEQADLKATQQKQANTLDRTDANVMAVCKALKVDCKERPARPE